MRCDHKQPIPSNSWRPCLLKSRSPWVHRRELHTRNPGKPRVSGSPSTESVGCSRQSPKPRQPGNVPEEARSPGRPQQGAGRDGARDQGRLGQRPGRRGAGAPDGGPPPPRGCPAGKAELLSGAERVTEVVEHHRKDAERRERPRRQGCWGPAPARLEHCSRFCPNRTGPGPGVHA